MQSTVYRCLNLLFPSIKYKELKYELQKSPHEYNAWKFAKTPRHYVNASNRAHLGSDEAHEQASIAISAPHTEAHLLFHRRRDRAPGADALVNPLSIAQCQPKRKQQPIWNKNIRKYIFIPPTRDLNYFGKTWVTANDSYCSNIYCLFL